MKGSLMATISTFLEVKAARVTRRPMRPNLKKGTVWFVSVASRWCCNTIKSLTSHWKPIHICFSGLQQNMGKNVYKNVLTDSLLHLNTACGSLLVYLTPFCVRCTLTQDTWNLSWTKGKVQEEGQRGACALKPSSSGGAKVKFKVQCGNPGDDSATFHQVAQLLFNHQSNILTQIHRVLRRKGRGHRTDPGHRYGNLVITVWNSG